MPEAIENLEKLPAGGHAVSFYASAGEAETHAAAFLAGTPKGQSAAYWVSTESQRARYRQRSARHSPNARIGVLPSGQVMADRGQLRPVDEVRDFFNGHPEGVTAGGETLSDHLTEQNAGLHAEYETWIDQQPHDSSRLLCPYDLRRLPSTNAIALLRRLGASHSHVALSGTEEPALRLLQLFVFPTLQAIPTALMYSVKWALSDGLIRADLTGGFDVTPRGQQLISDWSLAMTGGA